MDLSLNTIFFQHQKISNVMRFGFRTDHLLRLVKESIF